MIRTAAQVSVYGGVRGKEATRETYPPSCYRSWRRAFLGSAGALALLAASAVAANAQAVDNDVAAVPNNTTPVTVTLNALASQPGVVLVDVPSGLVTADASAIIRGAAVATPVSIVQLNSAATTGALAQSNFIDQDFEANAFAFADARHVLKVTHGRNAAEKVKGLAGSEGLQRGFLQALFTADGHVAGSTKKGVSVRLTSVSLLLLRDVQRMLLNFGIASRLYAERHGARKSVLPDGRGGMRAYDAQHLIVDADVCAGGDAAGVINRFFARPDVAYIHLHNARRGCFSCAVERA